MNKITNEQLERLIKSAVNSSSPLTTDDKFAHIISALRELRDLRSKLANREAQPVAYIADCGTIVSDSDPFFDDYKNPQPLYTAPPAPAYPERLPCSVRLMPGLLFGKGVPIRSMLDALKRREEYEAELESMTPEQRAENDVRLERLNALIPQPSLPAMPGIITASMAAEKAFRLGAVLNSAEAEQFAEGWNACRAAMLAQPVSSGYKLVPVEPTDEQMRLMLAVQWPALYREHLRHPLNGPKSREENERQIAIVKRQYAAMLAAAPEGGNDHDTRR